ncbi:MAG TPA: META domain-containing protein [Edaphobacter sp.]|jgi:heat shock protein HslJ|nr:META domain-containing protein [Edaphobacter sp.]
MRHFVRRWVFCLAVGCLAGGLSMGMSAQSGNVGGGNVASPSLEKTEWKLTKLGDTAVTADDPHRWPNLLLDPVSKRASGLGGCNRITGGYELTGERLTLGHMAATMMMCPSGMDTEQRFLKALGQVKRWKIVGRELELMDGDAKVVATFEPAASAH